MSVPGMDPCEGVCRACLQNRLLVSLNEQYVDKTLEEFTGIQVAAVTGCPRRLCAWCSKELQRSRAFRARCRRAARILNHIAAENQSITLNHLQSISLPSSLSSTPTQTIGISFPPQSECGLKTELYETNNIDYEHNESDNKLDEFEINDDLKSEIIVALDLDLIKTEKSPMTLRSKKVKLKTISNLKNINNIKINTKSSKKRKDNCTLKLKDAKKLKTIEDYEQFEDMYNVKIARLTLEEQRIEVRKRQQTEAFVKARYQCLQCYRGFNMEPAFKNHMISHSEVAGSFVCDVCTIRCQSRKQLLKHQLHHKRRFRCNQCDHVSPAPSLAIQHFRWHDGLQHDCKECGKQFGKRTTYLSHMRLRHGDTQCTICGMMLLGQKGLASHLNKAHKAARCECGVVFIDLETLNKHKKDTGACPGNSVRPCVQCGANFASDELLQQHVVDKHNTFSCDQCKKTYNTRPALLKHQDFKHKKPRTKEERVKTMKREQGQLVCEVCGYHTLNKYKFIEHQRKHTGETPFKCTHCPKGYRVKHQLISHMYIHTGELPHQCDRCPKAFRLWGNLRRHKQTVHGTERPYKCEWCDKAFKARDLCKIHYNTVHLKHPTKPRVRKRKQT